MTRQTNQNNSSWISWTVPPILAFDYILKIAFFTVGLPGLFGVIITTFGFLFNFLIIDFFVYSGYKARGLL